LIVFPGSPKLPLRIRSDGSASGGSDARLPARQMRRSVIRVGIGCRANGWRNVRVSRANDRPIPANLPPESKETKATQE
jgi:hypothetical protein